MSKNFSTTVKTVLQSIVTTLIIAISFTFAQGSLSTSTPDSFGFFGDMSIKVYCTFSNFIPGSDNSACQTDIFVRDTSDNSATSTTNKNGTTTVTDAKINQINKILSQGLSGQNARIVYVPVKGERGRDGTTTIVYQTSIPGAGQIGPSAYIFAGGNGFVSNPYQTTVPGDIFQTFIHFLQSETINTNLLNAVTANASTTNTDTLFFGSATGTNLSATGTAVINNLVATNSTTTNLFASYASLTNATTTNLFAVFANIWDFYFHNATGTNLSITNVTSTGTFALASGTVASTTIQNLNANNTIGNIATFTSATTTNVFATNASLTNATTTYFFAAWANFLNLFVNNLTFNNATGTNLQVANANTTNLSATGTTIITNLYGGEATFTDASTTNFNASLATLFKAIVANLEFINATGDNLQLNNFFTTNINATGTSILTNIEGTNATITSATTTNLFANLFKALNARIDNLAFTSATGTNILLSKVVATSSVQTPVLNASTTNASTSIFLNAIGTNATITNATITNLSVANCSKGNVLCNGGNDTGAVVGPDAPLVVGVLNAGNINFITGDVGVPSITPGSAKLIIETGIGGVDGNGAVRVTNDLKVGAGIVASGTLYVLGSTTLASTTVTNITGNILAIATAFINSLNAVVANIGTLNAGTGNFTRVNATGTSYFTNIFATTTNATTTNTNSLNVSGTSSINNVAITGRVLGDLIPSASSTYNLGSLVLPWNELFVSSSSVYIGGTRISNVNGILNWGGSGINFASSTATSSSSFGTVNASSSVIGNATFTSATSTNLFTSLFKSLNGSIDSLATLNATFTSATTTNFSVTGILSSLTASFTNLLFANATGTNATTTNFFSTSIFGGNSVITSGTSTNYFTTNFVGNNSTSTNLVSVNSTSSNSFVSSLRATLANIINFNFQNATGTNITATGTATLANLVATNGTSTNFVATNATFTKATTTDFGWINATGSKLFVRFIENSTPSQDLSIDTSNGGATVFKIDSVEKMRIDSTGNVGIGTNNPNYFLDVLATSTNIARFRGANSTGCTISGAGVVACTSDATLKHGIEPFENGALEKILALNPSTFYWNNMDELGKQYGFIAQEVQNVLPNLVSTTEEGKLQLNQTGIIPFIVKAIQEMRQSFFSEKVTTNQLCIGSECITEQDLRDFKAWKNNQNQPPSPVPEPVVEQTPSE